MSKSTPQVKPAIPFSKSTSVRRREAIEDQLEHILFDPPSTSWAPSEHALLEEFREIFPGASERMTRAAIRLCLGFVASMPELLHIVIPAHYPMLGAYAWGRPEKPDEAEGAGAFWLFRASNEALSRYEDEASPVLSQVFLPNHFRPLAVRCWIRLQTVYLDPHKADRLIGLAQKFTYQNMGPHQSPAISFVLDPADGADDAEEPVAMRAH